MTELKLSEYRRLTIRIAPDKLKALKLVLIANDLTIQDWLEHVVDDLLKPRAPMGKAACIDKLRAEAVRRGLVQAKALGSSKP